jgi:hypothetical protein
MFRSLAAVVLSIGCLRAELPAGAVSGFTSQNTIWPDLKAAVVVLSNKDGSTAPRLITHELEALLLVPAQDPDADRLLKQAKAIFDGLLDGRLDRPLFTSNCNSYFTPEVIAGNARISVETSGSRATHSTTPFFF